MTNVYLIGEVYWPNLTDFAKLHSGPIMIWPLDQYIQLNVREMESRLSPPFLCDAECQETQFLFYFAN